MVKSIFINLSVCTVYSLHCIHSVRIEQITEIWVAITHADECVLFYTILHTIIFKLHALTERLLEHLRVWWWKRGDVCCFVSSFVCPAKCMHTQKIYGRICMQACVEYFTACALLLQQIKSQRITNS